MFNIQKTTHIAAYLLWKRGGKMFYLKLMKLMYLAEKASLLNYGERLTGDTPVCMPQGPVLSSTYDLIRRGNEYWNHWIGNYGNYEREFKQSLHTVNPSDPLDTFDELSPSDILLLDEVFNSFGHKNRWDLVNYTHSSACPEWHDPHGSSLPISIREMLLANGKTDREANLILENLAEVDDLQKVTASLT